MARYTPEQKEAAQAAFRAGQSLLDVHAATGVELASLATWYATYLKGAKPRAPGGGRRALLDEGDLAVLRTVIESKRSMSLAELRTVFSERTGKTVNAGTIQRAMKELGYKKVKVARPPKEPAAPAPVRYTAEHRRQPTATTYPSSLTDREWEVLAPLVAKKDPRGRPAKIGKRRLLDAVFYVVRTGIQWRAMPSDLVPWTAAWSQFRRWRDSGTLERMYDSLHTMWREASERNAKPSAGIVDSQTVKTTEKGGSAATMRARRQRAASATSSWTRSGSR